VGHAWPGACCASCAIDRPPRIVPDGRSWPASPFLVVLLLRSAWPVPAGGRLIRTRRPALIASTCHGPSPLGVLLGGSLLLMLVAAPWWADAPTMRLVVEFASTSCWLRFGFAGGYAGLVSVGQQALVVSRLPLFLLGHSTSRCSRGSRCRLPAWVAALAAPAHRPSSVPRRGAYFAIGAWWWRKSTAALRPGGTLGGASGQSRRPVSIRSIAAVTPDRTA